MYPPATTFRYLARLLGAVALLSTQALAQQPSEQGNNSVPAAVVEARLQEVQNSAEMPVAVRDELASLYREILSHLDARRSNDATAQAFAQAGASAPSQIEQLRVENDLARVGATEASPDLPTDADTLAVEQRLQQEKANLAAATARLSAITQQLAADVNKPDLLRQRLAENYLLAEQIANELTLMTSAGEQPMLTEARRWLLSARASALSSEIRMLDEELLSQPQRLQLLELQREQTSIALKALETIVRMLEDLLAQRRRDEAARIIAESEVAALGDAGRYAVVRDLVERNRELSAQLEFLTLGTEDVAADIVDAKEWTRRIQQNHQTAMQRLEIAGLYRTLGHVLHEQRRDLPNRGEYRRKAQRQHSAIVASGLRDIQFDNEWASLQQPKDYLDDLLADIPQPERESAREPLSELIAVRRTLMRQTMSANSNLIRALGELDFEERQLLSSAEAFDDFLATRLMWVRSSEVFGLQSIQALPEAVAAFVAPQDWLETLNVLQERAFEAPTLGFAVLISLLLLWRSGFTKKALRATGQYIGNPSRDSFHATIKAVGLTILLVLPFPLLASVAGWELNRSIYTTDASTAIGIGLAELGAFLLFLLSARALCIDGGVVQAHFRWPADTVKVLRRELNRLLITFLIPGFVMVVTNERHHANLGGELGRVMFVIAAIALTGFFVKLLRPGVGLLDGLAKRLDATAKLPLAWLLLGAGIPAAMILAALAGFVYSAATLLAVVINTLWLLLGLLFTHEMISRWLLVIRQRLVREERMREWEAARAAALGRADAAGESDEFPAHADEPMVDVTNMDSDAHKLLNMCLFIALIIGLGAIWAPVLPALTVLDNVTLWAYQEGAAGSKSVIPVTLANLIVVLVIIVATTFSARSIPSLLETLLRQQTSVSAGSRLAFATLARYGIVLLGIIFIADVIGFRWAQIQWLVAALGVGIGFGMQEIFANLISGLVILVERTIRVGDVVTIGDVSGRVSRIQIRATTIINWDRQELLVPNKEFVTGRVLNWTLSDEVVRLVTNVGVSYGSDMAKALAIVEAAADENLSVLKDPKPIVTFDEFGDNSLNIALRCFISSPVYRREVRSALNLSINEKLKAAGIVVAFPQRDVHLDSAKPLQIQIQNSDPK